MRIIAAILWLGLTAPLAVAAENWPQFRGPSGDGHSGDGPSGDGHLPREWSESKNVTWKTPIHGRGWSSPVVWGDQIWLTTATQDGKKMFGLCVDRHTGKVLHDILVFENAKPRFRHATNSYASPTPVIESGRVYLHFGSYGTACLDTKTGKVLWSRRDLPCNHWRGPGSSPILAGDKLIVAYDGFDFQYVVALDKATGRTVWKKDRNIEYGSDNGDHKKAYSTCTVFEHDGRRQLISPSAVASISYDPDTGEELWRVRHGGMNAAIRPLYKHGLVYITAGRGPTSMIAVRPDGSGDVTKSHIVWKYNKSAPKRPSQLLIDDWMFMISDEGVASCIEAKTAKIIWQQRIGTAFRASPIHAQGRIYFFGEDGTSPVIEAGPKYKLLAKNKLDDGFQASPAVVGSTIYLRTTANLYCIEQQKR